MKEPSFDLYRRTGWQPRVDIYRCNEDWLVKVELAGVARQDIRIEVLGNSLIIEGQRKDWCAPDTTESLSMEITYDWFQRSIQLPDAVLAENMRTDYREGMLLIFLSNKS